MEDDLDAVEATFNTYKSFERFAIHDLAQYYALWFGEEQGYWLDANPTWGTPAAVNLMSDASQFAGWPTPLQTNAPPVINTTPTLTATKNIAYNYTIAATDLNSDPLTYSATTLPTWLNFNATSKLLSGTPSLNDIGNHTVTLQVSDGTESATQTFAIQVTATEVLKNLLVNGSFETNTAWDLWAGTRTNNCAKTGSYGVSLTTNEAGIEQKVTGLKPLTRYAVSAFVNTGGSNVGLGTKKFGGPTYETICNSNTFTKFTKIFTTGDTNTSVIIYLYRFGNTTAVCADDFELVDSSIVNSMNEQITINNLQVYPNPSESIAQIDFDLTNSSTVSVALYSMQGQNIQTLLENQLLGAGHQNMHTNALEAGVYICQITINNSTKSVKLVILK